MSLNGLDEAAIVEAHQASLAEAGGWFLVKYTNRDTVSLLSRGIGGVVETRLAVEQYEEKSPLYGMVQYRRKKIILKYVPDGTSRLLQVRLSVQFQSVVDTFIPHDTIFSFTSSSELTESALSSACMLGTRAGSMRSSSSSLRRRRLNEITEDVEEGQVVRNKTEGATMASPVSVVSPDASKSERNDERVIVTPSAPQSAVGEKGRTTSIDPQSEATFRQAVAPSLTSPAATTEKALPATPSLSRPDTPGVETVKAIEDQPILRGTDASIPESHIHEPSANEQVSSAEADRASYLNSYTSSYVPPKPKKKLGPRPHVESQIRPKTSGSAKSSGAPRPVANLPTSVQVSNRAPSVASFRPSSQQSSRSVPTQYINYHAPGLPPPIPSPTNAHIATLYRPPQRPAQPRSLTNPLTPTATPEKLRLMKALQMRKKNMMAAQRASSVSYAATEKGSEDVHAETHADDNSKSQLRSTKGGDEFDGVHDPMSSTASPISLTYLSEKPSTQSSFTTDNDERASRGSISSDTGSSVTPRADMKEGKSRPSSTSSRAERERRSQGTPKAQVFSQNNLPLVDPLATNVDSAKARPFENEHGKALPDSGDNAQGQLPRTGTQPSATVAKVSNPSQPSRFVNRNATTGENVPLSTADRDKTRRTTDGPLRVLSSPGTSDLSDDEAFLDELQHAKVEEAKPISVARTPATPIYSRGSSDRLKELSKATSTPSAKTAEATTSPERPITGKSRTGSARSVSSNLPQWPPPNSETVPAPLAKKGTLSSGISRRIKALEVFTSRDSVNSPPSSSHSLAQKTPKLSMGSFMKRSSMTPHQRPPNMSTDTPPPKELPRPTESEAHSENHLSVRPMPWVHRQGSETEINAPTQKGESISVTARIVRDNKSSDKATNPDPSEPVFMNLHRSPLIVEQHDKHESLFARPGVFREVSFQSQEEHAVSPKSERTRFSFTSHRSASQTRLNTSDSMASRMSTTTRKSNATMPQSMSDTSSLADEKKSSRASRLKKRMSILSTGSRRSLLGALSPKKKENRLVATIAEQSESPPHTLSDTESMAHVVDIGDLNVQFPDTLLWKRRFMRIDDQGYVIFEPPAMERNPRGISRKFHLSDFRRPSLPDNEREEMLWSIKLELGDGSCIQCACESKYAQEQVLIMLVNAHTAYNSLYTH